MKESEFEKMHELENLYWWFVGRRRIIKTLLSRVGRTDKILDIGAGIGSNSRLLSEFGELTAIDASDKAISLAKTRGLDIKKGRAEELADGDATYDLVTAFDVLEHIEGDKEALQEITRVLKPGGHVLVSVPAYKFLWSEHDEALGHVRRYSREEIKNKLREQGFHPVKSTHAVTLSLPAIILYRLLTKYRGRQEVTYVMLPKFINNLLILLIKIESKIIQVADLPFGASIFILARKNG